MAVREGFEPSIGVNLYTLSRRAPSTTQTPHRKDWGFYLFLLLNGMTEFDLWESAYEISPVI